MSSGCRGDVCPGPRLTDTCRSDTRCGSPALSRCTRSDSLRSSRIRMSRRQRCLRRWPERGRRRASGTRTPGRCARPCCIESARCPPGMRRCRNLDRSSRCKGRRCSSPGTPPCPACRQGPAGSRWPHDTSSSLPACTYDLECTWRKGRRRYRSYRNRFQAGSCRPRRSSRCKEHRRCSSADTRRSSCCTLLRVGNRSPKRSRSRHCRSPSSSRPPRIRHRRCNTSRCRNRRRFRLPCSRWRRNPRPRRCRPRLRERPGYRFRHPPQRQRLRLWPVAPRRPRRCRRSWALRSERRARRCRRRRRLHRAGCRLRRSLPGKRRTPRTRSHPTLRQVRGQPPLAIAQVALRVVSPWQCTQP